MKEVKISVIVPVYKTEKYLERCLESILSQTLKEIEVIIVNDGSPDDSYKIIEKFLKNDKRIKVINQENLGLSVARNNGIKKAEGEYILNIDSDDWIEQNYLLDIYLKAQKNKLDMVITNIFWDYDNGILKEEKDLEIDENLIISGKEYVKELNEGKTFPSVSNKLLKRSLYIENNIFHPEGISMGEDFFTISRLAHYAKKVGKIEKAYLHYIQNPKSIMNSNASKKIYELLSGFEILENFYKNKNLFDVSKVRGMNILLFNSIYDPNETFYREAIKIYLDLNEKRVYKSTIKRFYIYSIIFNKFPNFNMFKIIYKFNKLGLKIKSILG
ncbi:glycosyltransferase family 2 protein [Cetobacterium sp.]|uniref:glycosyltransferase family 2 protein n=1 Tax=Cetobacterium sp. TaxID=2071632 RepID=UPI003EE5D2AA